MPVFDFQHVESGEIISVYLSVKEPKESYSTQIKDGKTYKRVYSAPLAASNIIRGNMSKEDFRKVTTGKNYNVGDLYDISKEMSEERAAKNGGKDPVKEKFYKDYEKRLNRKHTDVIKREKREQLQKAMGIIVSD